MYKSCYDIYHSTKSKYAIMKHKFLDNIILYIKVIIKRIHLEEGIFLFFFGNEWEFVLQWPLIQGWSIIFLGKNITTTK